MTKIEKYAGHGWKAWIQEDVEQLQVWPERNGVSQTTSSHPWRFGETSSANRVWLTLDLYRSAKCNNLDILPNRHVIRMHLLILSDAVWCFNITVGCILTAPNISGKPPPPSCQNVACFACQIRCPGDIWEGNRGQESRRRERKLVWKASDTFAPAVPTCHVMEDHEWYRKVPTGWKPQRANTLPLYFFKKINITFWWWCLVIFKLLFFLIFFFYCVLGNSSGQRGRSGLRMQREVRIMADWKLFWTGFKKCWRSKTKHHEPQLKDLHMCWLPPLLPARD